MSQIPNFQVLLNPFTTKVVVELVTQVNNDVGLIHLLVSSIKQLSSSQSMSNYNISIRTAAMIIFNSDPVALLKGCDGNENESMLNQIGKRVVAFNHFCDYLGQGLYRAFHICR